MNSKLLFLTATFAAMSLSTPVIAAPAVKVVKYAPVAKYTPKPPVCPPRVPPSRK